MYLHVARTAQLAHGYLPALSPYLPSSLPARRLAQALTLCRCSQSRLAVRNPIFFSRLYRPPPPPQPKFPLAPFQGQRAAAFTSSLLHLTKTLPFPSLSHRCLYQAATPSQWLSLSEESAPRRHRKCLRILPQQRHPSMILTILPHLQHAAEHTGHQRTYLFPCPATWCRQHPRGYVLGLSFSNCPCTSMVRVLMGGCLQRILIRRRLHPSLPRTPRLSR